MWEESHTCSCFEDIFLIALQYTQLEKTFNSNLVGSQMNIIPDNAFLEHISTYILHLKDNVVDCSAFGAKFAINGKCSRLLQVQSMPQIFLIVPSSLLEMGKTHNI